MHLVAYLEAYFYVPLKSIVGDLVSGKISWSLSSVLILVLEDEGWVLCGRRRVLYACWDGDWGYLYLGSWWGVSGDIITSLFHSSSVLYFGVELHKYLVFYA